MNELGIILHNQTAWISKSELLSIGVLAFVVHILTIGFQHWIEGKEQLRRLSVCEGLRLNLTTIWLISFALFLYFSFKC